MVSAAVNVSRYTALFAGIAYGWYHRRTLQAAHDLHKLEHAVHQRERLISEAKDAWKRRHEVVDTSIVTNPDDPHFDLEKLIAKYEKAT